MIAYQGFSDRVAAGSGTVHSLRASASGHSTQG